MAFAVSREQAAHGFLACEEEVEIGPGEAEQLAVKKRIDEVRPAFERGRGEALLLQKAQQSADECGLSASAARRCNQNPRQVHAPGPLPLSRKTGFSACRRCSGPAGTSRETAT